MNCHRVQSLLSAYLDQELSPEEQRQIRNHIFHCPICAQNFEDLSHIKSCLGNLEPPSPQVDFFDQLLFDHFHVNPSFSANPWLWGKRLAFTTACVFLFLLTSFYLFPVEQNAPMMLTQDAAPFSINSTPYQLVSEEKADVNLFIKGEEDQEEEKRKNEYYFLPEPSRPVPGIPVSR